MFDGIQRLIAGRCGAAGAGGRSLGASVPGWLVRALLVQVAAAADEPLGPGAARRPDVELTMYVAGAGRGVACGAAAASLRTGCSGISRWRSLLGGARTGRCGAER